jgi:ACS family D-galactonate transporter-like MFS transporter
MTTTVHQEKHTNVRWFIVFLVCVVTFINYLDRTNLAIAAPFMSKQLGLNAAMMGIVFSAFGWAYTLMQIPCGWLVDTVGARMIYFVGLFGWSVFTALIGLTNGFAQLVGCRIGLGLFEAPAFPLNGRIVSTWFPSRERGLATGLYTGAEYIGLAFCTPFLTWLLVTFGWESIFYVTGGLGMVAAIGWLIWYRDPANHKKVNEAELDLIKQGGGLSNTLTEKTKVTWKQMRQLFAHRQLWGMYIGIFSNTSILWFFLTWFPSYLVTEKHITMLSFGIFGVLPYIAAICGVLIGGKGSDWLLAKGFSTGFSRKTPIIVGLLFACSIIGANYTDQIGIVIGFMSLAFCGQGMVSTVIWALMADIAPRKAGGMSFGVLNFSANLGGTLSPLAIGFIVNATHSFSSALVLASSLALIAALSFLFLVPRTPYRIEITE